MMNSICDLGSYKTPFKFAVEGVESAREYLTDDNRLPPEWDDPKQVELIFNAETCLEYFNIKSDEVMLPRARQVSDTPWMLEMTSDLIHYGTNPHKMRVMANVSGDELWAGTPHIYCFTTLISIGNWDIAHTCAIHFSGQLLDDSAIGTQYQEVLAVHFPIVHKGLKGSVDEDLLRQSKSQVRKRLSAFQLPVFFEGDDAHATLNIYRIVGAD
ncbi:hypothetical protein IC617_08720 [Neiella sp. HB171785]|uniref:Uncharacterized protein n=1 Tax=Neiella litorisoli TaxID=2771431 RepID=A0A8J6QRT3_9GAMM|nr:hypothetical protein [Neiella litorisoli]MBD1389509.1 hypothetical protein [Neiella litorisoli]